MHETYCMYSNSCISWKFFIALVTPSCIFIISNQLVSCKARYFSTLLALARAVLYININCCFAIILLYVMIINNYNYQLIMLLLMVLQWKLAKYSQSGCTTWKYRHVADLSREVVATS